MKNVRLVKVDTKNFDALIDLEVNEEQKYESYREKDVYKQRFVGYKYSHVMKLEFDSDNERLGKILYRIGLLIPFFPFQKIDLFYRVSAK